jgi:hypothetical protein
VRQPFTALDPKFFWIGFQALDNLQEKQNLDGATPLKIAAARGNVQKLGKEPGLAASGSPVLVIPMGFPGPKDAAPSSHRCPFAIGWLVNRGVCLPL